jgi:hypothetical protein
LSHNHLNFRCSQRRFLATAQVFTFSVTVTLQAFNEPPDTLTLEAEIEPKPE